MHLNPGCRKNRKTQQLPQKIQCVSERARNETHPKNASKMDEKCCPGGARGTFRAVLGPPGGHSRPVFLRRRQRMDTYMCSGRLPGRPGDPEEPQNSTQSRVFSQKGRSQLGFFVGFRAPSSFFCRFFDFVSIFHENLTESPCKNRRFFLPQRCFFPTWRPSRNSVFYGTKATFSIFEFLFFF